MAGIKAVLQAPRAVLLDAFTNDVSSVLLAVASFWEGVDVPGEADKQVARLLAAVRATPSATLVIVSDHGMTRTLGLINPKLALERAGITGVRLEISGPVGHVYLDSAGKLDKVRMLLMTNVTFDGHLYNVMRVMEECLAIKPDLIFLDIRMPKITGFELLEMIESPPRTIFSTAYDEYAIKAFEHPDDPG